MGVPLAVGEMAVQHGDAAKPAAKPANRLRRQADFRHQHDRLPAVTHGFRDGSDVDFRLAAAGDAVQHERFITLSRQGLDDGRDGPLPDRHSL